MKRSTLISAFLHAGAIVLIVAFTRVPNSVTRRLTERLFIPLDLTPYRPVSLQPRRGGGGGGQRDPAPARYGLLARFSPHKFVAPTTKLPDVPAPIMIEPTILADVAPAMQQIDLTKLGSPAGVRYGNSGGDGSNGGIGDSGSGGGVGNRKGPGYGDGEGSDGITTDGPAGSRTHMTLPVLLLKTEPEYSEEARRAKIQGTVVLSIQIDAEGRPRNPRVLQSLGLGLEERAIETVLQWKFKAATRNGRPVPSIARVEVSFRLL